jgi:hypothetical protein
LRHTKAIVVGVIDAKFVLIQKKNKEREICSVKELYIEEEVFDINGLSHDEIEKLIPSNTSTERNENDFERFKLRLIKKIEEDLLREKGMVA